MRSKQEIKTDLLAALASEGDGPLNEMGFKRRKGMIDYTRKKASAGHTIAFVTDLFPRYQPDAEAHIHPMMRLAMPSVSERALALVNGNKLLLANAPEVIVNQPIEFTAPKDCYVRWFATGQDEFQDRIREIVDFVQTWTIPLLDELASPESLIHTYLQADDRLFKQQHWYLYVAAAFDLLEMPEQACEVLETKLGAPGLRRYYAAAFENLGLGSKQAE
jgi:hypothetical protein